MYIYARVHLLIMRKGEERKRDKSLNPRLRDDEERVRGNTFHSRTSDDDKKASKDNDFDNIQKLLKEVKNTVSSDKKHSHVPEKSKHKEVTSKQHVPEKHHHSSPAQKPAAEEPEQKQSTVYAGVYDKTHATLNETCTIDTYSVSSDGVPAEVYIFSPPDEYVPIYRLTYPRIPLATHSILNSIREELITLVNLSTKEFVDPTAIVSVKERFSLKAHELIKKYLPGILDTDENTLVGYLIHEMLGLGVLELLIADNFLEEIVVNNSKEPIWVYHKRHGWVKTTVTLENEDMIYNYSSSIGRRVGRQITNLYPLMDAHLYTGDRVNATLFPISTVGNTITIRKFARSPWTIIHMLDPQVKTISSEAVALLWLAIQYELNLLIVGGTASGKSSFLNTLMPFIPPNQRVISIEDTRELNLPKFLQWIPFSSREPNPEGKGGVSMLDLLMNSLRMRPDRIIVGEIRRSKEVEVMFEAIRTGHSAYATFHADSAHQAYQRIINPPISLPESMLNALHLVVVQYRHRRLGIRRTLEIGEIVPVSAVENKLNILYKWDPKKDLLEKANKVFRIYNEIGMYTGMADTEIEENLKDRKIILDWMVKHNIKTVNSVGKVIAEYYKNEKGVTAAAKKDANPEEIIGKELMDEVNKALEEKN
ncbi:Type II/IV secretion system protein [uncultured archaeon]|nr:Type II/IV secretion system protein [uncultured archaeon]